MRLATAIAVAGLALAVAACGEGSASGSDGVTRADVQDAGVEYARCMRKDGIDVADPQVGTNGLRGVRTNDELRDEPGFQAADEACRKFLTDVIGEISPEQRRELQDARLKFARCMRGEGFDVPDPQPGAGPGAGGGQGGGGLANLDPSDPRVQRAMEKCSKSLPRVLGAK
jgi:hypothetical protein